MIFAAGHAWAVDPFTVRDIRVEGLQRVEPGTIFGSLPFRVGESYSDEKGAAAIRVLFGLGLFKDIRIEVNGDVLVVIVEERPTVADVEFVGTKEFEKDVLKKALRDVGLAEGRPFDKARADRAEQELKRQYISRSLYGAEIITTVTHAGPNATSRQLIRSVLAGHSTGTYLGKVAVARGANGTDASQSVRAMLLDRSATANAKPELEIYADDVKCAHGCAVGELDANGLFYLESRGLPPADAKKLMLQAFVAEAFVGAADEDNLRALAQARLEQIL